LFYKVDIDNIWLIDFFGGAANITVADYFKAAPVIPAHVKAARAARGGV
jgi:hypothetical protein|tara:strand:- start:160 stop:306 length:147 start_codon:yes stop_codon:yes gene_type:complete